MRIGIGWDRHQLAEGRDLYLGGVKIPYSKGLLGHSDGDVLIHAIIDAILGAANLGDIGSHFPDTDDKRKDIRSVIMLRKTVDMIKDDYRVGNIDAVVILKEPKISEFAAEIKQTLAKIIGAENISVKAKSGNGVGPEYQGKCVTCHAAATLCPTAAATLLGDRAVPIRA